MPFLKEFAFICLCLVSPLLAKPLETIALADFIDNVEAELVESALNAGILFDAEEEHSLTKRAQMSQLNGEMTPIVVLQSTETAPELAVSEVVPAHVVLDRISVFPLPANSIPLVPTFEVLSLKGNTEDSGSSSEESLEDQEKSNSTSEESEESVTTTTESISSDEETTTLETSATEAPVATTTESKASASTTVKTTTPKTPIDDLNEAEEELKEKVAEIEADPVILSARV